MPLPITGGLYTPYFNRWNADVYTRSGPFLDLLAQVPCDSTSGACVAIGDDWFVGATALDGVCFGSDGKNFFADARPEQLFVTHHSSREESWLGYHAALALPPPPTQHFGWRPEYCTWVEQKWVARHQHPGGTRPFDVLTTDFVCRYLEFVSKGSWPSGRFTIDEGWCPRHGPGGFGDWEPRSDCDLRQIAAEISSAGHLPGLWLAPFLISEQSLLARRQPHILGERLQLAVEMGWDGFRFLRPCSETSEFLDTLLSKVAAWGFRKVKVDLAYGPKAAMAELHGSLAAANRRLPSPLEIESHVPDPFVAQHVGVVRLNDVLISDEYPKWQGVAQAHFRVCRESAPTHLLNLDHLGGNDCAITAQQFVAHAGLMASWLAWGYPVVSLLPHHVGTTAEEATSALLQANERLPRSTQASRHFPVTACDRRESGTPAAPSGL